jgi:hypothetical protein
MRLRDLNVMAMNEMTNTKDKRIRAIHVPESDRWALRDRLKKTSSSAENFWDKVSPSNFGQISSLNQHTYVKFTYVHTYDNLST